MVKLTVENEEVKKEINSRWVFAVSCNLEDGADGAIALLGPTSPRELAETVGKSIGAQFKYLAGDISSQIKLCKILSEAAIIAVFGNNIQVIKEEVDLKECGETSAED